ncbi:hypothetical protein ACQ4WX_04205 [Streptomyces lasalocidi]
MLRHRQEKVCGNRDPLGVAAAADQRHHPISRRDLHHTRADLLNLAERLPGRVRRLSQPGGAG